MKLESTIHDSQLTATVNLDPSRGLKDEREMTSTLVTTEAGSAAAGFEGVSEGATGNPRQGQANPIPLPANPLPESLQYVTCLRNGNKGGFAGSEPVNEPRELPLRVQQDAGRAEQIDRNRETCVPVARAARPGRCSTARRAALAVVALGRCALPGRPGARR